MSEQASHPLPALSLTEWAVLALLAEGPLHGFALARQLSPGAPVGRVWTVPRSLVYRALARLQDQGLARPQADEPGDGGPPRTVYRVGRRERALVDRWLETPVPHLRDVRSELLLKLVILEHRALATSRLLHAQREAFSPLFEALGGAAPPDAPLDAVACWRRESSGAVARLLEGLLTRPSAEALVPAGGRRGAPPPSG